MKIGVYDIVNDPLPKLYKIRDITVNQEDFEYDEDIVKIMNKYLKMDKLDSEHMYALSLTYGLIPRGIIYVSKGDNESCKANLRGLAIGLLLTGAEQFICFHNHPGGNRNVSKGDKILTEQFDELGDCIGISFLKHIMITKNYYCECE